MEFTEKGAEWPGKPQWRKVIASTGYKSEFVDFGEVSCEKENRVRAFSNFGAP